MKTDSLCSSERIAKVNRLHCKKTSACSPSRTGWAIKRAQARNFSMGRANETGRGWQEQHCEMRLADAKFEDAVLLNKGFRVESTSLGKNMYLA